MIFRLTKNSLLVTMVIALVSPSLYAQSLEQRVDRLERIADNPILLQHSQRLEQQQREIQSLYDQLDHMHRQLADLNKKLAEMGLNNATRIERLEDQVDGLRARSAASDFTVEAPTRALVESAGDVEPQLEVEPSSRLALNQPVVDSSEPDVVPASASAVPEVVVLSEQDYYNQAFQLLRENKFDASIVAWNAFIEQFPDHSLTSNAYYWLGEAYMIKQDFEQAFRVFNQVIVNFNQTDKYPDALLRAADSLVGLNRLDEAKAFYHQLIEQAPHSRSAKTAERRLARFNAESS